MVGCQACVAAVLAGDDDSATPEQQQSPPPAPVSKQGAVTTASPSSATPTPSPIDTTDTTALDGRYECFQMRVVAGPNFTFRTTWVPGALPGFTITRGSYTSSGNQGRVTLVNGVASFEGGSYAGWRGVTGTNTTGFHIRFRGNAPGDPNAGGTSAKSGDYQCYRQKG